MTAFDKRLGNTSVTLVPRIVNNMIYYCGRCDAGEVVAAGSEDIHGEAIKLLNWDKLEEHEVPAYGAGATS